MPAAAIPIPPRGYWAKLRAGKPAKRPPLPSRPLGVSDVVEFGGKPRWWGYQEPADLLTPELPPPPSFDQPMEEVRVRVSKQVARLCVVPSLLEPHPVVKRVLNEEAERAEQRRKEKYYWKGPYFTSPFEQRRLAIANGIFQACAMLGAEPLLRGNDKLNFGVKVGDQNVWFHLDSPKQLKEMRVVHYQYHIESKNDRAASEVLKLEIARSGSCTEFTHVFEDKPRRRLERQWKEIVTTLIVAGESLHRIDVVDHHNWLVRRKADLIEELEQKKEAAIRAERERQEELKRQRIKRLLGDAARLRKANAIRTYVETVRARLAAEHGAVTEEVETWSQWAVAQADEIDPILGRRFLEHFSP